MEQEKALELRKTDKGVWELDFNDPKIQATLQATVARGTTKEEYWLFANYCMSKRLNPLAGEVWCIKTDGYTGRDGKYHEGRLQIMTGINGYWTIANSHPEFDGEDCVIEHGQNGKPLSATATVWRKDRTHPHKATVYFEEYYRPGYGNKPSTWDKMPRTMLEKVAYAHVLRRAFPQDLNGTYIPEEMPPEYAQPTAQVIENKREALPAPEPLDLTGMCLYRIPESEVTDKTHKFFAKRGGGFDAAQDLWYAPRPVEKDAPPMAEYRQLRNQLPDTEVEEDDVPDWHEEANAKVEAPEKPLEKAKRRAKEIEAKSKGALEVDQIVESMNLGE